MPFLSRTITVANPQPIPKFTPVDNSYRPDQPLFIKVPPKQAPQQSLQKVNKAPIPSPTVSATPNPSQTAVGLAYNETRGVRGDRYAFSQPSGSPVLGDALGKYQITEEKLSRKSKELLGREIKKKEFLASPALQEALIIKIIEADYKRLGDYKKAILTHRYENPAAWDRPQAQTYLNSALRNLGK